MLSAAGVLDPGRIFAELELAPRRAVIAAVSGGSDSLSLLFLLKAFLDARAPATRLVAVTVNHGLRAGSAEEAAMVAALCEGAGIAHRTVRWSGEKPASGLPAAAREARYELLAAAAEAERSDCVLTGHTLDDQLETVSMRAARGDGRGLAGMAPATLFDGRIWILRPLLGLRRAELRSWLAERGVAWIEDPTNVDPKYERARLRAAASRSADIDGPARTKIASAATARIALGRSAAIAIGTHMRQAAPGLTALDLAFADTGNGHAGAIYALRIVLAAVGGTQHLPDTESSALMFGRICTENFRATLSRVVIDAAVPAIFLRRERRSLPGRSSPMPGSIWDGRFRLGALPPGVTVAPVGKEVARKIVRGPVPPPFPILAGVSPSFVTEALAAEPGLWRGGTFAGLALEAGMVRRTIAPWARFLPSFDLAPAEAVAALLGAQPPPRPPLASHNPGRA